MDKTSSMCFPFTHSVAEWKYRWEKQSQRGYRLIEFLGTKEIHKTDFYFITNGGRSDGGAAAESLEASVDDFAGGVVNLDLEFHDVAACRCTHQTGADGGVILVEGTNVAGVVVVIHHPLVVLPRRRNPNASQNPLCAHSQQHHHFLFAWKIGSIN